MKPTDIQVGQRVRYTKGRGTRTGVVVGVRTAVVREDAADFRKERIVIRAAKLLRPVK